MTLGLMCAPSADRINQDSCSHKQMRLTTLLINRLVFMFKRPDVWHAPMNKIILTYQVSHNVIFEQVLFFRSIHFKSLYSLFCQIFRLFINRILVNLLLPFFDHFSKDALASTKTSLETFDKIGKKVHVIMWCEEVDLPHYEIP